MVRPLSVAWFGVAAVCAGGLPMTATAACNPATTLGVSRVLTIDTAEGPRFGHVQYRERQPLADREVILTFDDGPSPKYTRAVLKALAGHCTKATFFMVGRMAVAYPGMVREVGAAGHTIAAHTWSHKNLNSYSAKRAAGEIELGISAVTQAAGRPIAPFFRFPYLAAPSGMVAYLKSRNVGVFSIDVDSYDFKSRSSARMRRNVMKQLKSRGRGIILMHDIQRSTAHGIKGLLDDLKTGGFKVVHVVAKTPLTTRADYDELATEFLAKRRYMVSAPALNDKSAHLAARPQERASKPRGSDSATHRAGNAASRSLPVRAVRRPVQVRSNGAAPRSAPPAQPALAAWQRRVLGIVE